MRNLFTRSLFLCAILFCAKFSFSQGLNYQSGGYSNLAGTYTDLGTSGTAVTMTNNDSGYATSLPIGFTFNFNGAAYTTFSMYVDGFIKLGGGTVSNDTTMLFTNWTQPPTGGIFNSTNPQDTSLIVPFGQNLWPCNISATSLGTGTPDFRYSTTGTTGSRVCTIQWKNLSDKYVYINVTGTMTACLTQYDTINFQVKLYEGTNAIEFVYGRWVGNSNASQARFTACGIKGNNTTTYNQMLTLTKASSIAWTTITVNTGNYPAASNAFNYGNPSARPAPDIGRIFHFTPVVFNDIAVVNVYAQGKIALPYYVPDSIHAYLTNPGVNNQTSISVVLNISGANSYTAYTTVPYIASQGNAIAYFPPYTPTNPGLNIIRVYTYPDDNPLNDTATYGMSVNNRNMAWTDTTKGVAQSYGTTVACAWANQFYVNGTVMISQTKSFMASNSNGQGDTVCGIVMDLSGNILGRSPSYVIQASDLGTYLTFNISKPPVIKNGYFLAGIANGIALGGLSEFFGTVQNESPNRPADQTPIPNTVQNLSYQVTGASNINTLVEGNSMGTTTANPAPNYRLMMECMLDPDTADVSLISSTLIPTSIPTGSPISFKATVKNIGSNFRASGIGVKYSLDGGTPVGPVNTSIGLNQGDTTSVFFTGTNTLTVSTTGAHTLKIFSTLANDQLRYSDTLTIAFTAAAPIPVTISSPYRIAANILNTWTAINNTGSMWQTSATSIVQPNGVSATGLLLMNNLNLPVYDSKVISPVFSFASILHPVMNFYVAHSPNAVTPFRDDSLQVMVSTDNGITFTTLYAKSSQSSSNVLGTVAAVSTTTTAYVPAGASDWRHEAIDLSSYAGNANVMIAFRGKSAGGNSVYISDIVVTNTSSVSIQNVISTGTYTSGIITVNFSSAIGNANGKIGIQRYMSVPYSSASPVYATNSTATTNTSAIFTPNNVSPDNWWTITYSGIGTGNLPSTVPYSLLINITGVGGMPHPDSLYIMKRSENNGSWTALSTTRSGTILLAGTITGFSDFAIGSMAVSNPLPVKWLNISATRSVNDVVVKWSTVSEINNDHFSIERSLNNKDFIAVGDVQSIGNSTSELSYSFVDRNAMAISGTLYYRIRQYNLDGSSSVSNVAIVNINAATTPVSIYPNPFGKDLVMSVNAKSQDVKVVVMDINGREVYANIFHSDISNPNIILKDLNTLEKGFYMMNVTIDGNTQCLKLNKTE